MLSALKSSEVVDKGVELVMMENSIEIEESELEGVTQQNILQSCCFKAYAIKKGLWYSSRRQSSK